MNYYRPASDDWRLQPNDVNVLVFVLNVNVNVGVLVVPDPAGIEPAVSTAYVTLGPLDEATI